MQPVDVPKHVAIIMDGNGRWAQKRRRPRFFGHVRGSTRVKEIVKAADRAGVKALTLFAFSTENWQRPESELDVLWNLLRKFVRREIDELNRRNVRFSIIGELERLAPDIRESLQGAVERLSKNTGLHLTLAISYGGRKDLVQAAQSFAADCLKNPKLLEQVSEKSFENYLWTSPLGVLADVDLLIRTSGEKRISNFLLWQAAYAEFVFVDLSWPDFTTDIFYKTIQEYSQRQRRFGGISHEPVQRFT